MFNNSIALNAYRYFDIANNTAAKATEKIASGQRINRAADGVADISIAGKNEKSNSWIRDGNTKYT